MGIRTVRAFVVLIGACLVGVSLWRAVGEQRRVSGWPRASAVVVRKEIKDGRAQLSFRYPRDGASIDGAALRLGTDDGLRKSLRAYEPGTAHTIGYNPANPREVEFNLGYNWDHFGGAVFAAAVGAVFLIGGTVVFRRSLWRR